MIRKSLAVPFVWWNVPKNSSNWMQWRSGTGLNTEHCSRDDSCWCPHQDPRDVHNFNLIAPNDVIAMNCLISSIACWTAVIVFVKCIIDNWLSVMAKRCNFKLINIVIFRRIFYWQHDKAILAARMTRELSPSSCIYVARRIEVPTAFSAMSTNYFSLDIDSSDPK